MHAFGRGDSSGGPGTETLEVAAECARIAKRLTADKGLRTDHGAYQSSLGEVLLASGKFDDALGELQEIFKPVGRLDPDVGTQGAFDEIRWNLAQAYVCASSKTGTAEKRYARQG